MKAGQLISRLEKASCDADVKMTICGYDIGDVVITVAADDTEVVQLEAAKEKTV